MLGTIALTLLAVGSYVNHNVIRSPQLANSIYNYQYEITAQANTLNNRHLSKVDADFHATPTAVATPTSTTINAQAYLVYDRASGEVIMQKNQTSELPIASLTKLVTVAVILQNHSGDEIVTVPSLPQISSDVAIAGIKVNESYTVSELASAMLVSSSADAAYALAIWDSGSERVFVDKMNEFAKEWGLENSSFSGVVGLDDILNYSSPKDLVTIVNILLHNKFVKEIVAKRSITIDEQKTGQAKVLFTTNAILAQKGMVGFKTGTTLAAGQCFIGLYRDDTKDIITVILGSRDRFTETQSMLNYSFKYFSWQ